MGESAEGDLSRILRILARNHGEQADATELVNEAYLRLAREPGGGSRP